MKRAFSALLSLVVLIAASPAVFAAGEAGFSASQGYIVRVAHGAECAALARCENIVGDYYYAPSACERDTLAALGFLVSWEENTSLSLQDYTDGYEPELWNLASIGASAAWAHKNSAGEADRMGDGVTIAIVDSGVMLDHPDLEGANILTPIILSSDNDGIDDYHGTFIAGIIAAQVNNGIGVDGMVPNATILPICITSNGGKTDVATAAAGLKRAADEGADVIIFSIGGTSGNEVLKEACEYAVSKGVIFVTCAGNYSGGHSKSSTNYMYPAAYDSTVTVSACRQDGNGAAFDEGYSYFNDAVTVSAPGTRIVSLYLDGNTVTKDGTSFAAPVVAAMAVMAKQAIPDIGKDDFVELLKTSSIDLGDEGYDVKYGYGYVNVPAFLTALDEMAASQTPENGSENGSENGGSEGENNNSGENSGPENSSGEGSSGGSENGGSGTENPPSPETPKNGGSSEGSGGSGSEGGSGGSEGSGGASGEGSGSGGSDSSGGGSGGGGGGGGASGGGGGEGGSNSSENEPAETEPVEEKPLVSITYSDVSDETWGYEGIRYVTEHGLMNGVGDGLFAPERTVSRAMLVTILWRIEGEPEVEGELEFTDAASGSWYDKAVRWAVSKGIVNGYGDGRFGPNDGVKREQVAAILFRYARFAGALIPPETEPAEQPDMNGVSDWAFESVSWAMSSGIFADLAGGDFIPSLVSNRAETAMILTHYCKNLA